MSELKIEAEAAEVGLDPGRLQRIDRHFARYVDDGRLPGWLISAYPIRPQLRQLVYQALTS